MIAPYERCRTPGGLYTGQRYPGVIVPRNKPRNPVAHGVGGSFQRQPGAKLFGGGAALVGEIDYDLLLLFNDGNESNYIYDQSYNHYTVTFNTNDGANQKGQSTEQVLFGDSSLKSSRGGSPEGTGGRNLYLSFGYAGITPAGNFDWGTNPDALVGMAIWPTFPTLSASEQYIISVSQGVARSWSLRYNDAGTVHFNSYYDSIDRCNLDSTIDLVYGEWNWLFLSLHGGVASFWIGTHASGVLQFAGSAADTTNYAYAGGSLTGRVGSISDPMNCYLDHIYAGSGAYIEGTGMLPVPDAEPDPIPLVWFDFEQVGQGTEASDWVNQGTAAFTTAVSNAAGPDPDMRNTSFFYSGVASCEFDESNGWQFEYGGTAMDIGANPKCRWKVYYYPTANPSSFAHTLFGWGSGVNTRFVIYIVPTTLNAGAYCVVGGSTKFNISGDGDVALNQWNEFIFEQDGAGGVELIVNNISIGTGSDGGVDYSGATFGNFRWGAEPWTGDNYCEGYMDDFTLTILS